MCITFSRLCPLVKFDALLHEWDQIKNSFLNGQCLNADTDSGTFSDEDEEMMNKGSTSEEVQIAQEKHETDEIDINAINTLINRITEKTADSLCAKEIIEILITIFQNSFDEKFRTKLIGELRIRLETFSLSDQNLNHQRNCPPSSIPPAPPPPPPPPPPISMISKQKTSVDRNTQKPPPPPPVPRMFHGQKAAALNLSETNWRDRDKLDIPQALKLKIQPSEGFIIFVNTLKIEEH